MGTFIDLAGQRFGHWVVIGRVPNPGGQALWHCSCICGVERDIASQHLRLGKTQSCGCINRKTSEGFVSKRKRVYFLDDLTGQRFTRWTVLAQHPERARVGVLGTVAYRGHGDSEDAYEWARNEVEQQYGERFRDVDHLWWELVPVVGKAVRRQRCTTPSTRSRR